MKQFEFMRDPDGKSGDGISISNGRKNKLDLIPRLVCIIVAIVIWLWTVNLNDTDITETMVIKIDYTGISELESSGMMIYGMDKTEITVTIQGSNRDLRKYSGSEYSATVDVSRIKEMGQYTLPVSVNIPLNTSIKVIESEPLNVNLRADESVEKSVPFDVMIENGATNHSYNIEKSVSSIEIKGPKAVIDMIEYARFSVNGSLLSSLDEREFHGDSNELPLTFWDKNLNQIVVGGDIVTYSTENIDVTVNVIAMKEIPVVVSVTGSGSNLAAHVTPDKIRIYGAPSRLDKITQYTVVLKNAEVGKTYTYVLNGKELPDGVSFENEGATVTVNCTEAAN